MITLDPLAAQAILEPVHPGYPVTEVLRRTGGEVSAVYEIRGARPLIVKVYDPRWRPKLLKEVYIYRLLARHGIRLIPRVLHASPYGTPALPFAHIVMTRLPGRPLAEVRETLGPADLVEVYRQMGALLGAVHRIGQPLWGYLTTRVVDAHGSNTGYMSEQFARRLRDFDALGGDPCLARRVARHVEHRRDLLATCPAPMLCHNDFHEGNVLVEGTRVTGCVDVEGAIAADPLLDIAKTEYYTLGDDGLPAFLEGYGPLPAGAAPRLALYRLHHALDLWNWSGSMGKPADQARARHDIEALLGHPS